MSNILKRLFCKHDYQLVRNIYGDEINYTGYKRSIFKCSKCNKYIYRDYLYEI